MTDGAVTGAKTAPDPPWRPALESLQALQRSSCLCASDIMSVFCLAARLLLPDLSLKIAGFPPAGCMHATSSLGLA